MTTVAIREGPRPLRVSSPASHVLLSERDLAHLWEGQRFPPAALSDGQGRPLSVVYRGRLVGGPGPDFRDAIIAGPWGLLQGDVELHVWASDFRRHGHHRDPAYDGLALHVVFADDEGCDTVLASGRRVPVAALAPWFQRRAGQIRAWLRRPALWQEPCRSALTRLGAGAVAAALDGLGERRFQEKAEAMRLLLGRERADQVVWRGLLEALGYGGDRQAFRALALHLPWPEISETLRRLPARQRVEEGRRLLLAATEPGGARRGRPGNEGWRRLEGAARLAARFCRGGLASSLGALLIAAAERGPGVLLAAVTVADSGRALSTGRQAGRQAFIGRSRALEIVVNVVLPYTAACGDAALAGAAGALYGRLPRPAPYGVVHHLERAVGGAVRVDARRQQGMLHLLRWYCSQGGCGRCPLS